MQKMYASFVYCVVLWLHTTLHMKVDEMLNTCISHHFVALQGLSWPIRTLILFQGSGTFFWCETVPKLNIQYSVWWVLLLGLGQQWNDGFEMPYADFQEENIWILPVCWWRQPFSVFWMFLFWFQDAPSKVLVICGKCIVQCVCFLLLGLASFGWFGLVVSFIWFG